MRNLCLFIISSLIAISCKSSHDCKKDEVSTCCRQDTVIVRSHSDLTNPDSALAELSSGNERYIKDQSRACMRYRISRKSSAEKQTPFAVIVTCSDSRLAPEIIFDQAIGDLFVVRTAGEVIDSIAIGSIEYAVEHLGAKLIVVLGHERCGAVTAAVKGGEVPAHIKAIVNDITPSVEKTKTMQGDHVDNAIRENVNEIVMELKESEPILKELSEKSEIKIIGGYYDLDEGSVVLQ